MKNSERSDRLSTIKSILEETKVSSQKTLLRLLRRSGITITQATLSRDLKTLNVSKRPDGGGSYVYVVPGNGIEAPLPDPDLILRGFLTLEFSGSLGVIKTLPGYANSVASGLDILRIREILGTVAGDDTILLIAREGVGRDRLVEALVSRIPAIRERLV
jgi:transcriptional regulator of arginine metabolism